MRPDADILKDLRWVEIQLSPENLSCDGELSIAQIKQRQKQLNQQRRQLVQELGREPTRKEIYGEDFC